ncbi:unnamed protein product [Triticum turgidum subsp. durum]|uniref:Uncharacterized protein n=1 Tax=Triticum turgidum subsp. durum TaxID=4567 RepID=A0A9R0TYL1_TRITD|nr:unnamed protein product [Triticum turgidum subsp. durum]
MKMSKAPVLLKKAVTMCKSKTGVLAARLLFLASLRRRMATVGVMSHKIHALMAAADRAKAGGDCHKALVVLSALVAAADREKGARVDCHKALVVPKVRKTPAIPGGEIVVNISHQLALFDPEDDGDGGCTDRTLHTIFNDDDNNCCYTEDCEVGDDEDDGHVLLDECDEDVDDQPPVIDVIRNNREAQGLEFSIDNEIDQAADMFITRFQKRMNQSF